MISRARLLEAVTILMLGVLYFLRYAKYAVMSAHIASTCRVPFVDIRSCAHKRRSLNVTWRCACACVMNPNRFETTYRGGFGGIGSIRIDDAVLTQLNRLDLDLWRSTNRPLILSLFLLLLLSSSSCSSSSSSSAFLHFICEYCTFSSYYPSQIA